MTDQFTVDVRFYRLSDKLQPYFTALYSFAVDCPANSSVQDQLHPEWAAMRFTERGTPPVAALVPGEVRPTWPFVASGPTSKAIRFGLGESRIWGLGLQPAGWAKYVTVPAKELSDTIVDASQHDAFGLFAPILDLVRAGSDPDETALAIDEFLLEQHHRPVPSEDTILACQEALRDPEISDVAALAERVRVSRRTLERLCGRYFGFPPKLLLRRQRFLRSLARFMLETRQNWSKSLDGQYYDQAHFVRDFRRFMGSTPSEYARTPHPILDRIMGQRMADQGAAPQTDLPTLMRYIKDPLNGDWGQPGHD